MKKNNLVTIILSLAICNSTYSEDLKNVDPVLPNNPATEIQEILDSKVTIPKPSSAAEPILEVNEEQKVDVETFKEEKEMNKILEDFNMDFLKSFKNQININISKPCSFNVEPDVAVITGGIVKSGESFSKAKEELMKTLENLKTLASEKNVELVPLELIRFQDKETISFNSPVKKFIAQRIEIHTMPDDDIDSLIEIFETAGLNRLGGNLDNSSVSSKEKIIVTFRFRNQVLLENKLFECKLSAITEWCQEQTSGKNKTFCEAKDLEKIASQTSSGNIINVSSQPVIHSTSFGQARPIQLGNNFARGEMIELIGNIELRFAGTVSFFISEQVEE